MRAFQAELRASREILPGQWLQTFHAPALAASVQAGQFVHVRTPDLSGLVLRRPLSVNTFDRNAGELSLHFRLNGVASAAQWLVRMHPPERVEIAGPLGRGWEVDTRSRHLLLVAGGLGIRGVRSLVDEALAEGRRVALLFGARTAAEVYPSSLLPEEVEYVVSTDDGSLGHHGPVTDLVPGYEAWADQAFAAGPEAMLAALAKLAQGRSARLGVAKLGRRRGGRTVPAGSAQARRAAWLQVTVDQNMGCALGTCLGCVVMGRAGPLRACREGPVFASGELAWGDGE
jgi:dihydroorotate dehydrogenase electron transfer subunit